MDAAEKTDRGLTQTVAGGVCTVRGTANSTAAFNLTLYGSYYNTEPVFTLQPGTYTVKDCMIVRSDGSTQKKYENTTFTLTEELGVTWVATRSYQPGEVVEETTYPMLCAGTEALPWEPYSGGVASPCPAWPQELQNLPAPVVSVYGENIFDASKMDAHANKALDVADDGAIIVATGGGDKPYTSSILQIDVDALRGNTLIMAADSITNSNTAANGGVQLNVHRGDRRDYVAISAASLTRSLYIGADVTDLYITIYTNNTANALDADNVVTVKGLRLNLNQPAAWSKCAAHQALTIAAPNGLPGFPVASGGNYIDADGQRWLCDEVDLARGVYVQRVGNYIFDGSEDEIWQGIFTHNVTTRYVNIVLPHGGTLQYSTPLHCNITDSNHAWGAPCVCFLNEYKQFTVGGADMEEHLVDLATFKAYIVENPIQLVYPLGTAIETALTDAEIQEYLAIHSNKPTTTVLNDAGAHMVLEYAADPKTYIDNKLAALIAGNN